MCDLWNESYELCTYLLSLMNNQLAHFSLLVIHTLQTSINDSSICHAINTGIFVHYLQLSLVLYLSTPRSSHVYFVVTLEAVLLETLLPLVVVDSTPASACLIRSFIDFSNSSILLPISSIRLTIVSLKLLKRVCY